MKPRPEISASSPTDRHGRRLARRLGSASALASVACGLVFAGACAPIPRQTTIRATVPEGTPVVYVAGSVPELGSWDPGKVAMEGDGRERVLRVAPADDAREIEFKFTLGSWAREALGSDGRIMQNQRVARDGAAHVVIAGFREDRAQAALDDPAAGGVVGTIVRWEDVTSRHLARPRTVEVWLPPGYDPSASVRHPVIYAHDGQNMFDPRLAAFGVDWGLDEAIVARAANPGDPGRIPPPIPAPIVVAIWNTADRRREYNPWDLGDLYARFLVEELKPRVDAGFRTRTDAASTMTLGSSMGGLISFHLCRTRPEVFGLGACVSTHVPFHAGNLARAQGREPGDAADETPLMLRDIAAGMTFPKGPRLWFDYGTVGLDAAYEPVQREVDAWLARQGLVEGVDFTSRRYDGADHSERAWRARVGDALAFLLRSPGES